MIRRPRRAALFPYSTLFRSVSVDDALLVSVLDGVTDLVEQFEPLAYAQAILVAILGDRRAAHQLHDEVRPPGPRRAPVQRSEEHTSELQSRLHLVCRLLLEK